MDALFNRFGKLARLVFAGGNEVDALVIHRLPDKIAAVFEANIHSQTDMFEIRLSEIPADMILESIKLADKIYTVQGEPIKDQHNIILKVDAYETENGV